MIQVQQFTFNPFQENTYILYDETKACIIIDPGNHVREEDAALTDFIAKEGLAPQRLLNTHCHIDHVFGNRFVAQKWHLDLEMHRLDLPTLTMVPLSAQLYGIRTYQTSPEPKKFLEAGDIVRFGTSELEVRFVPGHAPGHIAFVAHPEKLIIGGDLLFQGSIGRTDLPGGDFDTLIQSVESQIFSLDDSYTVFPGHGPETTVGREKKTNPFFNR
ncbi:MAG: MBL fold metallo-hydrolase [Salibacteraceae bacterium]